MNIEEFKEVMPANLVHRVDDSVVKQIEDMLDDEGMADSIRENIISYTSVMTEGKFTVPKYLQAVKYASYKLLGDTNHVAFSRTFPSKMAQWKAEGREQKEIARYTTAYNQSKLVTLIMAQARLPTSILNADKFQDAINTQAKIMTDMSISPMVRMQAANSIMTHVKPPEATKIELDVSVKNGDVMDELRVISDNFAKAQQQQVLDGKFSVKDIAEGRIISEEAE